MTLYEKLMEKYYNDDLIDYFLEKRKQYLSDARPRYLHKLIQMNLLAKDLERTTRTSYNSYEYYAKNMFILGDFEERLQDRSEEHKEILLKELDIRLRALVLNQVTYRMKMNLRKKQKGTS
ncbi:hypothetical protein [Faecalitalea cylindroides]|uniref:hypothetical protein n=1 Tax=Faecalitalea cylindroides TaxID=39483 RepID=UPI000B370495|nr:hypothetical protein [Faecalitalea cylindroides]OUN62869.1 hypothetical protein B5G15_01685 [Faecalitalea cylindroides]